MTHSPYGGDPGNSDNFNENNGLPRYPETNHPEDQPGFGQNGYEGVGYQGTGVGNSDGFGAGQTSTRPSDGKVGVFDSIGWGFKATFSNAKLWILGALLVYAIVLIVTFVPAFAGASMAGSDPDDLAAMGTMNAGFTIVTSIISLIVSIIVYRLVLRQIDNPNPGWGAIGKDVRWGKALPVAIIVGVVVGAIMLLLYFLFAASMMSQFTGTLDGPATDEAMAEELGTTMLKILGGLGLILLISLLLNPLYVLMVWFASDGKSIGQSLSEGFRAGVRNFFPLLGLNILLGFIVGFSSIIPFLPILTWPAYVLAMGHAYRQAAGGPVPVEGRRG